MLEGNAMKRWGLLGGLLLLLSGGAWFLLSNDEQPVNESYEWVIVADGFTRPLYVTHTNDERIFVVEQRGLIWELDQDFERNDTPFLDIQDRVNDNANEQGLLSVAFDPNYSDNGYLYVNYTNQPDGVTVVSRFEDQNPDSEVEILTIPQPYSNHNGGLIKFGADGYLWIGTGDGGSGGDPLDHAQNPQSLLGKMLRIDVSSLPYGIPDDNPFVDDPNVLDEIWALGLRNPWRWSFDRETSDLYIGDVGQGQIEEITIVPTTSTTAFNYGWRHFEGDQAYDQSEPLSVGELTDPQFSYTHNSTFGFVEEVLLRTSHCSVTGGYTYRGEALPDLQGIYLFGDFCSGTIWAMDAADDYTVTGFMGTEFTLSSFGEDAAGELYATSFNGDVWRLQAR